MARDYLACMDQEDAWTAAVAVEVGDTDDEWVARQEAEADR
jgi:hypothetical protein